ncbi:BTAD domain-containing putative transcriptional regulator [Kribbella sp. NPDC056861]|uniref:BTAD domain-containing putative transcriptional regulator n=1 Tax=Kribbella sp. NPDC056861 TaxID=3154857 RepID=UPI003423E018
MSSSILGTLRVQVDGAVLPAARPAVRNVLGALLLHPGETLNAARVAELGWGPGGCSSGALQTTVTRLRDWLKEHCGPGATVDWDGHGYRLDLPDAEDHFAQYQQLTLAARPTDPAEGAAALHHALSLWRGPIFADGPEWIRTDPLVRRWEESRISLALEFAIAAQQAGTPDFALDQLEQLAAELPYDERVHARLLTTLLASGRRAEALRRYDEVRRRLADELGVSPSSELAEIHSEMVSEPRSARPPLRDPLKAGELVIGSHEAMIALPEVRALLAEMKLRHPEIALKVRHLDFVEQVTALPQGQADVIVAYLPVPPGVPVEPLSTGTRVVVVSNDHELASRKSLTLADMANRIVVSLSPSVHQEYRDFWAVDPRPDGSPVVYTDDEVTNLEELFSAVAHGPHITVVPAACRELYPRPDITYIDVLDMEPITVALAWMPGPEGPAISTLVKVARRLRKAVTAEG